MQLLSVFLTIVFTGSVLCSIEAQWRAPRLSFLGPEDGLSAHVFDMAQDSTGYIYFGTNVGLYRYDGHRFDFFGHDPNHENSIGAGDVYRIHAAKDGLIWLTLRFGGLNSFNPRTGEFTRYPLPEVPFRSVPGAHGIFEDPDHTLWVGATHFRLMAFDRKSGTYTTYSPDWIDPVEYGGRLKILSIEPDKQKQNLLWLSVLDFKPDGFKYADGIVSFDKITKQFKPYPCSGETMYADDEGILWGIYWGNFISKFDPATLQCDLLNYESALSDTRMLSMSNDIEPFDHQLLVASSKALLSFDKKQETFEIIKSVESLDESLTCLLTDRDHNLWIGTNQGTYNLDQDDQHIRFFELAKFGTVARLFPGRLAYNAPEDAIYLAHTSDKLSKRIYRIPLGENQKEDASFIATEFLIHGIATDHHHRLWIGGDKDIHLWDPSNGKINRTSLIAANAEPLPWLFNMKSNSEGWIGAVGYKEFLWFHADSQKLQRKKLHQLPGSAYAKSVNTDFDGFSFGRNNRAYLFSNEIFLLDLLSGEVKALSFDQRINPSFQHVQYAGEDEAGNIWISTFELIGRFQLIDDSLEVQDVFTINDGLISPTAAELHFDENGRVWAFTSSGMNCIDPVTREVRYFGKKEGLPNPYVDPRQVLSTSQGRIATVCANGLIVFDANALWQSVAPADESIVINQIRIGGEQVATRQSVNNISHLNLKPDQTLVDIEFQALAYPTDYRMEYSYRISGINDDWISIGQNKLITLPSLSPGQYTFEVKAGRPESRAPVKMLTITVETPIYKRAWFVILVVLILSGGIFGLLRWRIHRIRQQEIVRTDINKKMAELELKALRSQMNPHFMFNSLNSIKNYILQAEPKLAAEYLSSFAHLIRMILQNSREKSISLQDELETLMLYIELEQLRFDEEFDFNCIVDGALQLDKIKIPPMLLQPYVENSIWHGLMHKKERGHLFLQFAKDGNMVTCTIEDDGVGRKTSQEMKSLSAVRYKSMGMGITQDRIEIMNKMDALGISTEILDKYDAEGNPSGTRVIVRIPYMNGSMV